MEIPPNMCIHLHRMIYTPQPSYSYYVLNSPLSKKKNFVGVNLVVRPNDVNITEGDDMMKICVEFVEGQIPAERAVMLSVSETSSESVCCE